MTTIERIILLKALTQVWEQEANEDVLADRLEIERLIAWQVLAISGAYDRHAEHMREIRDAKNVQGTVSGKVLGGLSAQ
jgi:hypothetical protein